MWKITRLERGRDKDFTCVLVLVYFSLCVLYIYIYIYVIEYEQIGFVVFFYNPAIVQSVSFSQAKHC